MKSSELVIDSILKVLAQYKGPSFDSITPVLNNLTFLYHTMRASEDLLRLAKSRANGKLKAYYTEHLEEERGHAEWLERDLKTVGIDAKKTPIPREAVEMVGTQLYLIRYVGAPALLGYMALQECFPKSLDAIQGLEDKFGKDLFRTLRYHAEHDVDHGADLLKVIDQLPRKSQMLVLESAMQSARYFGAAAQNF